MISVIIPTLNEAGRVAPLLQTLNAEACEKEIIVVDGGSHDRTAAIARYHGVCVLASNAGRGRQLRMGATSARGDILLFLHADSRFPTGGLAAIERTMAMKPEIVGGNFRLLFDGDTAFDRWLDGFYAGLRRRGIYYGDSGIFVRREVYAALGGIKPIALMEDYDFARRLERFGKTCSIDEPALVTSSRRFNGRGFIGIVLGWLRIHLLYSLGVSPRRLARLYDRAAPEDGMRFKPESR